MSKLFLLSVFSVLWCVHTSAQQDSSGYSIVRSDASLFVHDAGNFFTAPLHFDREDWMLTGVAIGGTIFLSTVDESARSLALRNQSHVGNSLASFGTEFGREQYPLLGSAGLYITGLTFKSTSIRETGLMLFESIAFAGLTTLAIKSLVGRSRPFLDEGSYTFRGIQFQNEHLSFPSGHATVGFAISSLLAARIKNVYATAALYSAAAITAFSRVYNDEHWLSDVFFGAVIGTASGMAVSRYHDAARGDFSVRVVPLPGGMKVTILF
ncbi:MAG: phosphatase PAP2 family protein [Ignavibacteriae bacterium]|nr:phosphatase PAP2 family protein [Ignavibacteriota bacterium]